MSEPKKTKQYEYTFSYELRDVLEGIFEQTGFTPSGAEKTHNRLKIVFDEPLPPASLEFLKQHVASKIPSFKLKKQSVKEK